MNPKLDKYVESWNNAKDKSGMEMESNQKWINSWKVQTLAWARSKGKWILSLGIIYPHRFCSDLIIGNDSRWEYSYVLISNLGNY